MGKFCFNLMPESDFEEILVSCGKCFTVLHSPDDDWIICAHAFKYNDDGTQISSIPLAIRLSPNFDSIKWVTSLSHKSIDSYQRYAFSHAIWVGDSTAFITVFDDGSEKFAYLTKMTSNGELLWNRKFIPTGWEEETVFWTKLESVEETPFNTIAAVGTFYDAIVHRRAAWMIHLDSV